MANFQVPAAQWNSLNAQDQEEIRNILRQSSLFHEGDEIVADDAASLTAGAQLEGGSICTTICNIAEQGAKALCMKLSGTAQQVCLMAATAAGDLCRSKC